MEEDNKSKEKQFLLEPVDESKYVKLSLTSKYGNPGHIMESLTGIKADPSPEVFVTVHEDDCNNIDLKTPMNIGSKIVGRYGNRGVVSTLLSDGYFGVDPENMPNVEIVPSVMRQVHALGDLLDEMVENPGQVKRELIASFISEHVSQLILSSFMGYGPGNADFDGDVLDIDGSSLYYLPGSITKNIWQEKGNTRQERRLLRRASKKFGKRVTCITVNTLQMRITYTGKSGVIGIVSYRNC